MIPPHMKLCVRKRGEWWYLTVPHLTGSTTTPYANHARAHGDAFRRAASIRKWTAARG